jgi:hypothetical protein
MSTDTPITTSTQIIAGRQPATGTLFIATDTGARINFPPSVAPNIAAMLAEFCSDNFERAHVGDEWMDEAWSAPPALTAADLPAAVLARFPIDPTTDTVVSVIVTIQ